VFKLDSHIEAIQHPVFQVIADVAKRLGYPTYVIGGFVRDHLLERDRPKDIDIVAVGDGITLARAVSNALPGKPGVQVFKTYGTAMLRHEDMEIEFVGARKESYSSESRNPEVSMGTLEDDQNRRDFTVNALAISLNQDDFGSLLDPFGGCEDLEKGIIRTPLDPDITYSDDPLRMLRAIRFASQLEFTIDGPSLEAIGRNAERIDIITRERIVDELHKILASKKPSTGFVQLLETGLLERFLPELTDLRGVEEIDGQKHKDNFYHSLEVVDNIAVTTDDIWLRWAALLHDIGKAPTKRYDKKIGWTFHGHEFVGSKMVNKLFKRLRMPLNKHMKFVQKMVMLSSRPIVLATEVTDSAIRRLLFDAGDDIESLMLLCEADITTKNSRRYAKYLQNFKRVRRKMKEVEERDHVRNFQPPVSGELIMETYGLKPCREVGLIKDAIKEAILEGEIANNFEEAFAYMKEKAAALGLQPKSRL
jgi:tRNA nucleotidyltransferase (CCA-adding enzyme)